MMYQGISLSRLPPRRHVALAIVAVGVALAGIGRADPAAAQQVLMPRDNVVQALALQYEETPVAFGLTRNGSGVIELFKAPSGESWTLVLIMPNGMSRVLVSGGYWTAMPAPLPPML